MRVKQVTTKVLVQDMVLRVAGTLNPAMGGPPVPMVHLPEGEVVAPDGPDGLRRSIYLQVRRSQHVTFLELFDFAHQSPPLACLLYTTSRWSANGCLHVRPAS